MEDAEPPRAIAAAGLVVLGATIDTIAADLTPGEAALVARAVPKRVRELAAGRALARRALTQLGRPPSEILATADRAPVWPAGISGSISHTDDYCAVALGERAVVGHVGIDVEQRGRLGRDLWQHTLDADERAWLGELRDDARDDAATVLFSAKEAFYKAQFPRSGVLLGFHDVRIRVEGAAFRASLRREVRGLPDGPFFGAFATTDARVWTRIAVPA